MDIQNHIRKNIKEIPYEGQEVDINGIEYFIEGLLKGMITFSHDYEKTDKGYKKGDKYYSREEIIKLFLSQL